MYTTTSKQSSAPSFGLRKWKFWHGSGLTMKMSPINKSNKMTQFLNYNQTLFFG